MIDTTTQERVYVSRDGDAGPYIMVPMRQLGEVVSLLDANNVSYWVDDEAISLDGKPEIVVVNLGYGSDPAMVQRVLDEVR